MSPAATAQALTLTDAANSPAASVKDENTRMADSSATACFPASAASVGEALEFSECQDSSPDSRDGVHGSHNDLDDLNSHDGDSGGSAMGGDNINTLDQTNKELRCWVNVKHPRQGQCTFETPDEWKNGKHRKVVSDFFGRNKKATASIPKPYFPILCRKCYQRQTYRMKTRQEGEVVDLSALAKLRCDGIIQVIEKMRKRTYEDPDGNEWPWWCGFELQLTEEGRKLRSEPSDLEAEVKEKNRKVGSNNSKRGKEAKRMHLRSLPDPVPDWLYRLCCKNSDNSATYQSLGSRGGLRYSAEDLLHIVKVMKTYCYENKCALPTVEVIPITIGELDVEHVKTKRLERNTANKHEKRMKTAASELEKEAKAQPRKEELQAKAVRKRREADDAARLVEDAQYALEEAEEDAVKSAGTLTQTREKADKDLTVELKAAADCSSVTTQLESKQSSAVAPTKQRNKRDAAGLEISDWRGSPSKKAREK